MFHHQNKHRNRGKIQTISAKGRHAVKWRVIMKRRAWILILLFSFSQLCFAHAGMADRFIERIVSIDAIILTIVVTQIISFLLLGRNWYEPAKHLRLRLLLFVKKLCSKWWLNLLTAWALSSFVISPYVVIACDWLWLLGLLLFLLFWLFYFVVVLLGYTRKLFLTGIRPLYVFLVASIGEVVAEIAYCCIYKMEWFRSITYYTDEEYAMSDFKVYPTFEGLLYLGGDMLLVFFCFAVPYVLLIVILVIKRQIKLIKK
jgi:hypothetical protein